MKFDDLFAIPSFINGAARVLDLGSTLNEYNYSSSLDEADHLALNGDWTVVGNDLWKALDEFGQKSNSQNNKHSNEVRSCPRSMIFDILLCKKRV